ncbi:MAG: hypothetical protein Q7R79_01445, partial [bacterium]|nr:hypothetical protein [bacterium]
MKKKLLLIPMLALMLAPITPAFATDDSYSLKLHQETGVSAPEEKEPTAIVESQSMDALKSLGTAKINDRVKALEKAIKNLDKSLRLTTEQKVELITDLRNHLDALKVLLGKIKAETDLAKLRELVKSIYTDHRIVAVVLPRIYT